MTRATSGSDVLRPLELATAVVFGRRRPRAPLSRTAPTSARTALERSLLPALLRAPCVVSFSGGRDSSALLAVAVAVARREGLADPIPVTLRFPQASLTDEAAWQEMVIRRLGCADWLRLEHSDALDLIGPFARRVMSWGGLPYPYNLHLLLPLMEAGRGGSFVTGVGGDQALFAAGRALDVLARRARPVPRDGLRIAVSAAPAALRRAALRGRSGLTFPWMTAAGNEALARAWLGDEARRPLRWNARLRELWRSRFLGLLLSRIATLAEHVPVEPVHPFVDADFLSALAAEAGATGFTDRSAAMRALFAEDLPKRVVTRGTKATFNEVLWNRQSRAFAADLAPDYLDQALRRLDARELVDPYALARHWQEGEPMANSFLLLQACWLAGQSGAATHEAESRTWSRV